MNESFGDFQRPRDSNRLDSEHEVEPQDDLGSRDRITQSLGQSRVLSLARAFAIFLTPLVEDLITHMNRNDII